MKQQDHQLPIYFYLLIDILYTEYIYSMEHEKRGFLERWLQNYACREQELTGIIHPLEASPCKAWFRPC